MSKNDSQGSVVQILRIRQCERDFRELRKEIAQSSGNINQNGIGYMSLFQNSIFHLYQSHSKSKEFTVMTYWGELENKAIILLQNSFRLWLFRRRQNKSSKLFEEAILKNIIICQSAIRRLLTKDEFDFQMEEKEKSDELFDSFCFQLQEGISLGMFSKKYGTLQTRVLRLDSERRYLKYNTSQMYKREIDIRKIYKVSKGLSGYKYGMASKHMNRCFSLYMKGGQAIDFETESIIQFNNVFGGFELLVKYMDSESPFFIDADGIPRRAGPSIIQSAIRRQEQRQSASETQTMFGSARYKIGQLTSGNVSFNYQKKRGKTAFPVRSIADEMRLKLALIALAGEYDRWNAEARLKKHAHTMIIPYDAAAQESKMNSLSKKNVAPESFHEKELVNGESQQSYIDAFEDEIDDDDHEAAAAADNDDDNDDEYDDISDDDVSEIVRERTIL